MSTPKERLDAFLSAGIGYMSRGRLDALRRDFDALLAEHRAEVEHLRTALTARRTKMNAAARDAALEEAAHYHDRKGDAARAWLDVHEQRGKANVVASWRTSLEVHRRAAVAIRALKSTPAARFIPESDVRPALESLISAVSGLKAGQPCHWLDGEWPRINALRERLGVDLDAACECGHVSIGSNGLCAATIRTAGGAFAACGCSHPSHAMPAKAEPVSAPPRKESERECTCTGSCRGADGLGPGWRCALQR
jgi:hypothetical protein